MPYIETAPFPQPKAPEKTQDGWNSSENLFFSLERTINQKRLRGVDYWRKVYKKAYQKIGYSQEEALNRYQGLHGSFVFEVLNGDEEADLDFLRKELSGLTKDRTTSYHLYHLGVICLRKPKPGSEDVMEFWGYALIQTAFEKYPDPLFPRAQIDERIEKTRQRRLLREKERRARRKKREPTILNPYVFQELGREFTRHYYVEKVEYWTKILLKTAQGRLIDYQEFQKKHSMYVEAAKKEMDGRRGYDKRRKRYDSRFFEKKLNSGELDAFNTYYWGLVALYTPARTEIERKECELLGFKLLEKSHELSRKEREEDGKKPSAFLPWAIKEEYLAKLAQPEMQSKRETRSRDIANTMMEMKGGEPEQVTNRKSVNSIADPTEEIPF